MKIVFDEKLKSFDERTLEYVEQYVYEEDRAKYLAFMNCNTMLAEYYRGHRSDILEFREIDKNYVVRWLRLNVDLVEYPGSKDVEAYLMYENIDEQKKADLLTLKRSQTDSLTGILNRNTFISKAQHILNSSKSGEKHALLVLDVDNFKHFNDNMGHAVGDSILKELATQIKSILLHDDIIGRLGGDEFFVLLKNIPNANAVAAKAKQICSLCIPIKHTNSHITVSIGIALIPQDGIDFDELYKKADCALYRKKEGGKAGYLFVTAQ